MNLEHEKKATKLRRKGWLSNIDLVREGYIMPGIRKEYERDPDQMLLVLHHFEADKVAETIDVLRCTEDAEGLEYGYQDDVISNVVHSLVATTILHTKHGDEVFVSPEAVIMLKRDGLIEHKPAISKTDELETLKSARPEAKRIDPSEIARRNRDRGDRSPG